MTLLPGTMTRGDMATVVVAVSEPGGGYRFRQSGYPRPAGKESTGSGTGEEEELYLFTLQKERRPPLLGCWMLKELLPMRHHMMFAGDSGGTVC